MDLVNLITETRALNFPRNLSVWNFIFWLSKTKCLKRFSYVEKSCIPCRAVCVCVSLLAELFLSVFYLQQKYCIMFGGGVGGGWLWDWIQIKVYGINIVAKGTILNLFNVCCLVRSHWCTTEVFWSHTCNYFGRSCLHPLWSKRNITSPN